MKTIKDLVAALIRRMEKVRLNVSRSDEQLFLTELNNRIRADSVEFVRKYMPLATYMPEWKNMFEFSVPRLADGMLLEFGVAKGKSINYLAQLTPRQVHGFDSFESFPEAYAGHVTSHDAFDYKGKLPNVRPNVTLYPGFFDKTLPGFLSKNSGPVAFIHIDCDLYSSTKTVFDALKDRIQDTYIQFDEYYNYWCWEHHEHRAFQEFLKENPKLKCEYVGFSRRQILVKVTRIG